MRPAVTNQLKELKYVRASQQVLMPLDVSGVVFEGVRGWVSHRALRKVQEQRQLLSKPFKNPCTMTFTSSFGLPCVHTLKKLEEEGKALLLEHFHPHWHLKRDMSRPHPILEPRKAPSQLNQRRKQPATSTRREPSAFETIEAATRPKALPKCSMCHTIDHTMTSKSCPLRYTKLFQPPASATETTAHTTSIVASEVVATAAGAATIAHATMGQRDEHLMVAMQAPTGHVEGDQALEVQALADRESGSHTSSVETVADCIIVNSTVVQQAAVASQQWWERQLRQSSDITTRKQSTRDMLSRDRLGTMRSRVAVSRRTSSIERQWVYPSGTTGRSLLGALIGSRWVGNVKSKKGLETGRRKK